MGVDFGRTNVKFYIVAEQTERLGDSADVADHFVGTAFELRKR